MERDFMGLKANDRPVVAVKEEVVEESKDTGSPGVPWTLQSKVSSLPHFTSVKSEHDEKPSRMMFDVGASQGHMNFAGSCVKQQLVNGDLLAAPYAILPSIAPASEPWINSKASEVPTQLTIFYDGTVNVFDDIPPEKVQAIMILAANGAILSKLAQAKTDVSTPVSVPGNGVPVHVFADRAFANQPMGMRKCSGMPRPISVAFPPVDQTALAAAYKDIKVPNTISVSANLANKGEPPVMVSPSGPIAATPMLSAAVPQARKASLARFLEKRKERVMKAAPYNLSKKAGDSATPESNDIGFSGTSVVGSCSVSSSKELA